MNGLVKKIALGINELRPERRAERKRAADLSFDYSTLAVNERLGIVADFAGDVGVLKRFVHDPEEKVRVLVAKLANGCQEIYRELAEDEFYYVRYIVASEMDYDESIVRTLAKSEEQVVLIELAKRFTCESAVVRDVCFTHEYPLVRLAAVESMSDYHFMVDVGGYRKGLVRDPDWRVGLAVAKKMHETGCSDGMLDLFKSSGTDVRLYLLRTFLSCFGFDEEEEQGLQEAALSDDDWKVRACLAYKTKSVDVLCDLLQDDNKDVRLIVASRIGFINKDLNPEIHKLITKETNSEVIAIAAKSYFESRYLTFFHHIIPDAYLELLGLDD